MTTDKALRVALEQLQKDTADLPVDDAVELIDSRVAGLGQPLHASEYLVHKATILRGAERLSDAVGVLSDCCTRYTEAESAHYFIGEYLVELGRYAEAARYLGRCIEIMQVSSNPWYSESAFLLRAYCFAKLGRRIEAERDLRHVADDGDMSWIDAEPAVAKSSVQRMIDS